MGQAHNNNVPHTGIRICNTYVTAIRYVSAINHKARRHAVPEGE